MDQLFDGITSMDQLQGWQPGNYGGKPVKPTLTQGQLPTIEERVQQVMMEYGPMPAQMALAIAMQPVTAGTAVGEAAARPTIPNITNAGMQTAMMVGRPLAALGILGGGYGAAAAKETGGFGLLGDAQAAGDGLTDAQRSKLQALEQQLKTSKWKSGAERRAVEDEAQGLRTIQSEYARTQNKASIERQAEEDRIRREAEAQKEAAVRGEYDRSVARAESLRDAERAKDKSFKDSDVGKIYEKTGGFAPMLMGMGAGAIQRMAGGAGTTAMQKYGFPAAEGAGMTFAGLNAPLLYDAYNAPIKNPEKSAAEAYARELPPSHPRKAEALAYAQSLPDDNPTVTRAWNEVTSPTGQAKRALTAVLEGVPAGITGANLPSAAAAGIRSVGAVPGLLAEGAAVQSVATNTARSAAQAARADANLSRQAAGGAPLPSGQAARGILDDPPISPQPAAQPQRQPPPPAPVQNQPAVPLPPQPQNAPQPAVNVQQAAPEASKGLAIPAGMRPNPNWEQNAPAARASVLEWLKKGGHLGKGDDAAMKAKDLLASIDNPGLSVQSAQGALKRLRDVLAANGLDPSSVSATQMRKVLKELPPGYFSGGAVAVGAGGLLDWGD